jgi:hypothetical protein
MPQRLVSVSEKGRFVSSEIYRDRSRDRVAAFVEVAEYVATRKR